jgi:uncharacterized membrane protein YhfC
MLLSIGIVIEILVTTALPIGVGYWLNKKKGVSWRVMSYGALAYFAMQFVITLLFVGFTALVENDILPLHDPTLRIAQVALSIVLGAVAGVLIRWLGMKYFKEDLKNLQAAWGIGLGYGGMETIQLVGLPLISTFWTMMTNLNIDPATTSLSADVVAQLEELWQTPFYIPLAGSLERVGALVMHLAVTVLILQVFKRDNKWFLAAAMGVELLVNGLIAGLSEAGLAYGWVILIAVILMAGNVYLLNKLDAFKLLKPTGEVTD